MDKKISQLSSLSAVSGNEAIPVAKSGANYKVSTATLKSGLATTESIPSKLSALTNDNNTVTDSNYVHTDNNYTSTEKSKLSTLEGLPEGGEVGQYLVKDANNNAQWLSPTYPVDIMDLISYGVEWDVTVADPKCTRIGNPELHRTLPIQSAYRGCIAQGKNIMYYLDANDWRLKQRHDTANILEYTDDTITITDGSVLVADQWIKLNDTTFGQVTSVTDNTATIKWEDTPTFNTTNSIIIGSRLNGYDGQVMVHIPRFYYRSWIDGNKRRVRTSTIKVDDTWIENPEMLVGAYRSTVLNTVPENMGYLSTLQVNSAISVVNDHDYCRGGGDRSDYDVYADTDPFRSDLCKPRTNLNRATMRTYARNASNELLCYDYYKTVFYWNYVIEYANFNCQDAFNPELTSDGYRQGGLDAGITTVNSSIWSDYNSQYPLTPCGYGDNLGNNTGIKPLIVPEFKHTYLSIWFSSWTSNKDTCTSSVSTQNSRLIQYVKSTSDYAFSANADETWGPTTYEITGLTNGQTVIFKERQTGYNYSTAVVLKEVTKNGNVTINWSGYNAGSTKYVGFSSIQSQCNIRIRNTNQNTYEEVAYAGQTCSMPRWRGFDNPFGDIYTNLEGVIIQGDTEGNPKTVYTTTNPDNFGDSDVYKEKMRIAGHEIHSDNYIKTFDLGETAEIIPSSVGGSVTTYKCDYHWAGSKDASLRRLTIGGNADTSYRAGLTLFISNNGIDKAFSSIGFRQVIVL